jgi:hypothetical protein
MTRLWHAGAETANLSEFSVDNSGVSLNTSIKYIGTRSFYYPAAAGQAIASKYIYSSNQNVISWIRAYVLVETSGGAGHFLGFIQVSGDTYVANIKVTTTQTFQLIKDDDTQLGSDSSAVAINEWHLLEIKNDATTNPGTIEARLDGVSFASGNNSSQGSWRGVGTGNVSGGATFRVYLDEIVLHDDGWPGPIVIIPDRKQRQRPKMFAPGLIR